MMLKSKPEEHSRTENNNPANSITYQIRFNNLNIPIQFHNVPELEKLGHWLNTAKAVWVCHSQLLKNDFENHFFKHTQLNHLDITIQIGNKGLNCISSEWRNL